MNERLKYNISYKNIEIVKPMVDGNRTFIGGEINEWNGATSTIFSPMMDEITGSNVIIGKLGNL